MQTCLNKDHPMHIIVALVVSAASSLSVRDDAHQSLHSSACDPVAVPVQPPRSGGIVDEVS